MSPVQPALCHPAPHCTGAEAERLELAQAEPPVLAIGELRYRFLEGFVTKRPAYGRFFTNPLHAHEDPRCGARQGYVCNGSATL